MDILKDREDISRIIVAILLNIILITVIAFAFGANIETSLQQLGAEYSSIYVLALLLFPFSTLQLGIWAGCSAWIFGGFIGGAISRDSKQAIIVSSITVIPYFLTILIIANQSVSSQTNLFDLVLFTEFITSFGINLLGALVGSRIDKKYF